MAGPAPCALLDVSGLLDELEAGFYPQSPPPTRSDGPRRLAATCTASSAAGEDAAGAAAAAAFSNSPLSNLLSELQQELEGAAAKEDDSHCDETESGVNTSCLSLDDWLRVEGVGLKLPSCREQQEPSPRRDRHRIGDRLVIEGKRLGLREESSWWDRLAGVDVDAPSIGRPARGGA
eukprot:TRINITY_DN67317_c0_g1_i1.p1 TRINITY_DN67317_c0_g1~~TRINITY_DN67317_c0_g1_i1.p1  ORF type:complete len:177 (+),score=47.42 TRINITY_DN67317_c0_g1_i1:34-564(+)